MRKFLTLSVLLCLAVSCKVVDSVNSFMHDDQVVAKYGSEKLYKSELERYIPDLVSPEDSANMARQFINTWASDLLYNEMATSQLSKAEMDVTAELEAYRRSLLKYRCEQRYVNDRLDTLITQQQVTDYYNAHPGSFMLERPVLKVRFVDILNDSPYKKEILSKMASDDYADIERADTLARSAALRYFDSSSTWMDAAELARSFGMDYDSMMSFRQGNFIKYEPKGSPDLKAAYICDIRLSGKAPVEYCEESIRDIILSARKHELLSGLERDLLEDALEHKKLVIF